MFRTFSVSRSLLAVVALIACDNPGARRDPNRDAAAGKGGSPDASGGEAGNAGSHAGHPGGSGGAAGSGGTGHEGGEAGEAGRGGDEPCCAKGTACAAGQRLCVVECPGTDFVCEAFEVCQQSPSGSFDRCVDSCDQGRACGDVCCAAGATCDAGTCRLADLHITADDVLPTAFRSVDVAPNSCEIQNGCVRDSGRRSVVTLSATVQNVGDVPLALGAPWESPEFHASVCAEQYLLANFIQAEVVNAGGDVVAMGRLPTSCVAAADGRYGCDLQGLAPGGLSVQPKNSCNTLDLTGLAAGAYKLRLTVNPDRRIGESDFENNSIEVDLEKPDCDGQVCGGICCPAGVACENDVCQLPDLRPNADVVDDSIFIGYQAFGENACEMAEMCVGGPGRRRLLQFESRIENLGPGDLAPGDEQDNPLFEYSSCHDHYHFLDFTDYKLLNPDGSVATQGHKQAFCLTDMEPVDPEASPSPPDTHPEPGVGGCNRLSAGWVDIYGVGTPCQWVDITDVPPGDYVLQLAVNPAGKVNETNVSNNVVRVPVRIPGETPCQEQEICGDAVDQDCDELPDALDEDCCDEPTCGAVEPDQTRDRSDGS